MWRWCLAIWLVPTMPADSEESGMARGTKTVGAFGVVLAFAKPIFWAIDKVGEVDVVSDHLGQLGPFLNSGWGTLVTVLGGCALIAWAVYKALFEKSDETEAANISNSGAFAGRDNTGAQNVYNAPVIQNYGPPPQPQNPLTLGKTPHPFSLEAAIQAKREPDIDIILGSGAPFDFYRSHINFRTHLIRVAVVATRRLTNCDLWVEKISGRLAQLVPVKVGETFDLNPGVTKYIDFVAYDEAISGPFLSAKHTIEAKFPINQLSNGVSYLDDQPYRITLCASAAETDPARVDCRLWVQDDKLMIDGL
jgi:hypothetical protein